MTRKAARPRGKPLPLRTLAVGLVAAFTGGASGGHAASTTTPMSPTPRLVGVHAAHHRGFDRIVFQFAGAPPARRQVGSVDQLIADPSSLEP